MNDTQKFRMLHQQDKMLHIGSIWNAKSALVFEKMGYQALGTSSAAIADTLGYEDGEQIDFDDILYTVKSILKKVSVPLTVDIEAGYSRNEDEIVSNILTLAKVGVAGINLEDSIVDKNNNRKIIDSLDFSRMIKFIKNNLLKQKVDIFLNARTDFFIMGLDDPLKESIERAVLYEGAGADGLFVPCISDEQEIKRLVDSISLPVNVMAMPQLPNFSKLTQLGIKRISSGPFVHNNIIGNLEGLLKRIEKNQSFKSLFE